MIVVRVELWSAVTGERTELARMRISNDGSGSHRLRSYLGETLAGRSAEALDKGRARRSAAIRDWPSLDVHVWNLVAALLGSMGYGDKRGAK